MISISAQSGNEVSDVKPNITNKGQEPDNIQKEIERLDDLCEQLKKLKESLENEKSKK
jgi:hypothetical protein